MDIDADIDLVKTQIAFHEAQAEKYANDSKRSDRHHGTALRFRQLLADLTEIKLATETGQFDRAMKVAHHRISLDWNEIEGLPDEVLSELSISESDKTEFLIQGAIRELGGTTSLDRLIVYLYRTTGEVYKRTPLNQRLYRMSQKDMVFSVQGKKGVYSLRQLTDEEAAGLN